MTTIHRVPALALARASDDPSAAERAVRLALRAAFGETARGWTARRRPGAARALVAAGDTPAPGAVSLSHRDGRAAALAAPAGWRVGVDLERRDAVDAAHARYFLDRAERDAAARLGLASLWALKEAAWKALSLDAATPFAALRLRFDGARAVGVAVRGGAQAVTARLVAPWPGWVLAMVWLPPATAGAAEAAT